MYDMTMYRVSFFHKSHKKANLCWAPGKILVAQGTDKVSEDWTKTRHCRMERINGTVRFLIDGKESLSYKDETPLKGDNWGFRLMVCPKEAYDNIQVTTNK